MTKIRILKHITFTGTIPVNPHAQLGYLDEWGTIYVMPEAFQGTPWENTEFGGRYLYGRFWYIFDTYDFEWEEWNYENLQ